MIKQIEEFAGEFFEKMGVNINSLEVIEESENIFFIRIDSSDSGLLIGNHGSVFEAIQNIFRSILNNKFDKKIRLHFEINDYVHNKDEKLFAFVEREIARAKQTGRNMKLPKFSAYERKKVHDYVGTLNDPEIKTQSKGEGEERRLYIFLTRNDYSYESKSHSKPEKIKLTIDIDGDDI